MYCFECENDSPGESPICEACGRPLETDPDRYFKAGMEAAAAGDTDRSISLLRSCVSLSPYHLNGRYNLGLALSMANKCDQAIEHYLVVAEQEPDYPGIYTALGQAAFGSYLFHVDQAEAQRRIMVKLLMKAVEQDAEDVDACFSLANAYLAIGTAEKALPWLKRAIAIHPSSSAIYFCTARAFKMLGRFPEAAVMARKSIQLSEPDDPFRQDIEQLLAELQQATLPM